MGWIKRSALLSTFGFANAELRASTFDETRSDCARPVGHGPRGTLCTRAKGLLDHIGLEAGQTKAPEQRASSVPTLGFANGSLPAFSARTSASRWSDIAPAAAGAALTPSPTKQLVANRLPAKFGVPVPPCSAAIMPDLERGVGARAE